MRVGDGGEAELPVGVATGDCDEVLCNGPAGAAQELVIFCMFRR